MKRKSFLIAVAAVIIVAALAAVLLLPQRRDFSRLRGEKEFNCLLITVDTLRADRLGCYGFPRIETPTIDGFASRGVKFEKCIAQTPLTLPSHTSLLTGTHPFFHGVRDNGAFVVPAELKTLAESFKDNGYATAAFVGAYVLDSKWGLDQGFDYYFDQFDLSKFEKISLGSVQRPANEVMDEALKWLEQNRGSKFFAWVHLYDPHTPYEPPPSFDSRYPKNPYLGEIAFVDSELGRLWRWLRDSGLDDNSFLVFASDHGESLGEHQEASHGFFVYQEAIHVPLIFVTPFGRFQGLSSAEVVSLVDIMPTLLEMSGLPVPAEVQGESLLPFFFNPSKDAARFAYSETYYPRYHYGWSELRSYQNKYHKLIIAPQRELYDLAADAEEMKNVAAVEPKILTALEGGATDFVDRLSRNAYRMDIRKIDEETRERLAALGYIGSFTDASRLEGKALANPKEKIVIFNELSRAREMGMSGRADEAIPIIQAIIAADPEINDAYFSLGNIYFKRGNFKAAIAAFEQSLERKPDDSFCVINIANSYQRLGQPAEAERYVSDYLKKGFSDPQLYFLLGTLCFVQKKYDDAIKYYDECLSYNADSVASHTALAAIYLVRENLAKAEEHIAAGLAINPRITNLQYNRAQLLEKQGKPEEAAAAYKSELEHSPKHFKASFNLSRLCRFLGREDEERRYLELTIEINPEFPLGYFYLARIMLNRGENYEEAVSLVKKGIELRPDDKDLPLGYFLLADLYGRLGQERLAAENFRKGQQLSR
jgi:arylsulfatase A-like enzyme/predicted Zn-dependent protease